MENIHALLSKMCRICGNPCTQFIPIFGGKGIKHCIESKIKVYLSIQVMKDDALPLHVCHECFSSLIKWHQIFINCQKADVKLRTLAGKIPSDGPNSAVPTSCTPASQGNYENPAQYLHSSTMPEVCETLDDTRDSDLNCGPDMVKDSIKERVGQDTSRAISHHLDHNMKSSNVLDKEKFPLSRDSAIQSTSSSQFSAVKKRHETVRVKIGVAQENANMSTEGDNIPTSPSTLKANSNTAVVISALHSSDRNVHRPLEVSVAGPSCLQRAPNKTSETMVSGGNNYSDHSESDLSVVDPSSHAEKYDQDVIEGSAQSDIPSLKTSVVQDENTDLYRTCFLCKKIINNEILLRAHEKGHLLEKDTISSFACKFCSEHQESFNAMIFHYTKHESKAKSQRKSMVNRKVLLCKWCGQIHTTEERLALHHRIHSKTRRACSYTCRKCGDSFHIRSRLSTHLLNHAIELSLKVHKCYICDLSFSSEIVLSEHLSKHTDDEQSDTFKCATCGKAFENRLLLRRHRAIHYEERLGNTFICSFCGKIFTRRQTLRTHVMAHSDILRYSCNQCGKGFKLRNSLIQHLRTHQGPDAWPTLPCHLCPKTFRVKTRLQEHLRLHTGEKPYACSTCGKNFHKVTALHTHEKCHTENRPFVCDICGKGFKWSKNLRQHKSVHKKHSQKLQSLSQPDLKPKIQPFQCEVCGKRLAARIGLMQHLAKMHNQKTQEEESCRICGKTLSSARGLMRHMKVAHENAKGFKCEYCNREYSTKRAHDEHRRSHTGEKPFKCNLCNKTFAAQSNLIIHKTVHSDERPYKCSHCEKQFKRNAHLVLHIRTHTGEKPYVCNICNRGFAQSNDLHKHKLTHSDTKAFTCICGKGFHVNRDLIRHQSKHRCSETAADKSLKPSTKRPLFVCMTCNCSFSNSKELLKHQKCHSITCHCGKTFRSKQNLIHHQFKNHPSDGVLPRASSSDAPPKKLRKNKARTSVTSQQTSTKAPSFHTSYDLKLLKCNFGITSRLRQKQILRRKQHPSNSPPSIVTPQDLSKKKTDLSLPLKASHVHSGKAIRVRKDLLQLQLHLPNMPVSNTAPEDLSQRKDLTSPSCEQSCIVKNTAPDMSRNKTPSSTLNSSTEINAICSDSAPEDLSKKKKTFPSLTSTDEQEVPAKPQHE